MPRPPLPDDQKRKLRQVRMTDAEYAEIVEAARVGGDSASDVLREGGLTLARRRLKGAKKPRP